MERVDEETPIFNIQMQHEENSRQPNDLVSIQNLEKMRFTVEFAQG